MFKIIKTKKIEEIEKSLLEANEKIEKFQNEQADTEKRIRVDKTEKTNSEKILNSLPFSVCLTSKEFSILNANKKFLELIGYEITEILSENISFVFSDQTATSNLFTKIKSKKIEDKEGVVIKNKKGQTILTSMMAYPIFEKIGDVNNYLFIFLPPDYLEIFDSSIQKKLHELEQDRENLAQAKMALTNILEDADEDRRKAELERDKTLSIINNLADGLIILENSFIALVNPAAKNFFQATNEDILGKSISQLNSHATLKVLAEMINQENSPFLRKKILIGDILKLEVSVILFGVGNKNTIIILHDITRESFVERMKTEFVTIAAHQLRTPLSAVKWILKMFLDGDMGEITETQSQFLQKTYESNERMINLVNDLLNVAKIEEGRFLQKMQKHDIADIILEAIGVLKEMAEKKGLVFSYFLPSKKLPKILVDKEKIILALQNIIENSVSYTKSGRIDIVVDYFSPKKEFVIQVKDTGIGIPKNQKERIFSKFFRGLIATETETDGTGLGLFIAKNIVEAHGGKIWFDSEEGRGSTFYFSLPAHDNDIDSKNSK
ncbi:MAG: ATP-binding protein [Candidatus Pacebacteria bacterium]|nr:ATP-binding protein [Candidatus Paceibacterota bacterium]